MKRWMIPILFVVVWPVHAIPDYPPCISPACYLTATPATLPRLTAQQGIAVSVFGFPFRLPAGMTSLKVLQGNHLKIRFKQCAFYFSWLDYRKKSDRRMRHWFQKSGIPINRYPAIVFESTPRDIPRSSAARRWIWHAALHEKATLLKGTSQVWRYRTGKFTIYHARIRFSGYRGYTLISERGRQDGYLYILDNCANERIRRQFIFSIGSDKETVHAADQ